MDEALDDEKIVSVGQPATTAHPATSELEKPSHLVALGASAGGLEALVSFFEHVEPKTGLAFVVIQHLSPDFKSMMDSLLARHTVLPVVLAEDDLEVKADHIYLITPRTALAISGGRLKVEERAEPVNRVHLPIDLFLGSLAKDFGRRAIAVILSGTGSDGTEGIRQIKSHGGLVFVQESGSARFEGMPQSAVSTGLVDFELPAHEIPGRILRAAFAFSALDAATSASTAVDSNEEFLARVVATLKDQNVFDFTEYKSGTLLRRIERRMAKTRIGNPSQYLQLLSSSPQECGLLAEEIMIGVTRFFRDAKVWEVLANEVIDPLVQAWTGSLPLRVWSIGCSTGEEAYSMAILFHEAMARYGKQIELKIFATDIDREAIEFAGAGRFTASSMVDVNSERLSRFFVTAGDGYEVLRPIRESVIFAVHNVLKDPPFTRTSLVSCRNLLIYLSSAAHRHVLSTIYFSLVADGTVTLGTSERIGEIGEAFTPLHDRYRIWRKNPLNPLPVSRVPYDTWNPVGTSSSRGRKPIRLSDPQKVASEKIAQRYAPPSFVIDADLNVLHTFGDAERYLSIPKGSFSSHVNNLILPSLRVPIQTALHRARKFKGPVEYASLSISESGAGSTVSLKVEPLDESPMEPANYFLASIEGGEALPRGSSEEPGQQLNLNDEEAKRVASLEEDLSVARETLSSTVEELEASNEELQSTNEELLASNEELQSTNEELQSVNEELHTVNYEYQAKIDELTRLTYDFDNLLRCTQIGTIFVDELTRIRKFTAAVSNCINLVENDIGRPIGHFSVLIHDCDLASRVADVIETGRMFQREVRNSNGMWFLMRINPFIARGATVAGAVITFVDITELRESQAKNEQLASIVASSSEAIIGKSLNGDIVSWNAGASRLFGFSPEEMIGKSSLVLVPESARHAHADLLREISKGRHIDGLEFERLHRDGTVFQVEASYSPVFDAGGKIVGISSVCRDVTRRKAAEAALEDSRRRAVEANEAKSRFLGNISHEMRTPLTAIIGYAERLAAGDRASGTTPDFTDIIISSGRHLLAIVDDLLDLSKIEAQKIMVRFSAVRVPELLDEVGSILKERAEIKGLVFRSEIAGEIPEYISSDPIRLKQILLNVGGNAIKFTEQGGVVMKTSFEAESGALKIEVSDTGIGLPADSLARIFDDFFQVASGPSRRFGGAGLGLAISKRLATALGGEISVTSELGSGSTFTIVFPVSSPIGSLLAEAKRFSPSTKKRSTRSVSGAVLVVDDTPETRMLAEMYLKDLGVTTYSAGSGLQALEILRSEEVDLVLLDIWMPGIDGFETAQRIRRLRPDMPLVAFTASTQSENIEEYDRAGFTDFIPKPFHKDDIEALVTRRLPRAQSPALSALVASEDGLNVLEEFLGGARSACERLRNACGKEEALAIAHRFKSSGAFGFPELAEESTKLQVNLREGPSNELAETYDRLVGEFERTIGVLGSIVKNARGRSG